MVDERTISSAQKIIIIGIVLCIIGLMFIPLLPWIGVSGKLPDKDGDAKEITIFIGESDIQIAVEHDSTISIPFISSGYYTYDGYDGDGYDGYDGDGYSTYDYCYECDEYSLMDVGSTGADCPDCGSDDWSVCTDCGYIECNVCGWDTGDYYSRSGTSHEYQNIEAYSSKDYNDDMEKATKDLDSNIDNMTLMYWLMLLFLIIGIIGVAVYRIGNRNAETTGKILIMIGAFALIFAILSVVFFGLCFTNIAAAQKATDDYWDENDLDDKPNIFLGYNYIPLILGIILLIITIVYMAKVFPKLARSFRSYPPSGYYPPPRDRGPPGDDYHRPPPRDDFDRGPPPRREPPRDYYDDYDRPPRDERPPPRREDR